jgi:GAF domain-containing protein
VADQVAVAIQNVQFFEAEQTARRQAESMRRIGQALTAALEESATQQTIVDELQTLLDVSVAELFMQDAFGKWTRQAYTAVSNFPPLTIGQAITIPDNPANPLHDVLTYARPAMRASFTALRLEALPAEVPVHVWLAVPIVMDEVVQGWVSVCRTTFRPFTAEQIAQASLFAMQAAVALRNAQSL